MKHCRSDWMELSIKALDITKWIVRLALFYQTLVVLTFDLTIFSTPETNLFAWEVKNFLMEINGSDCDRKFGGKFKSNSICLDVVVSDKSGEKSFIMRSWGAKIFVPWIHKKGRLSWQISSKMFYVVLWNFTHTRSQSSSSCSSRLPSSLWHNFNEWNIKVVRFHQLCANSGAISSRDPRPFER